MPRRQVVATVKVELDLTELVEPAEGALMGGREAYSSELGRRIAGVIIDRLEDLEDEGPRAKVISDVDVDIRLVERDDPRNPVIKVRASTKGAAR